MNSSSGNTDMPLGLGMALAQDSEALNRFSALPAEEQKKIIERTHGIKSSREMKAYINSIKNGGAF